MERAERMSGRERRIWIIALGECQGGFFDYDNWCFQKAK